mgnify:FL=1
MNFLKNMLFFIFPRKCEMCETISESYICDKCKSKLEKTELYLNRIDDYSKDNTKYFDEHAYIFEYNSIIREKIIEYKFKNKPYLGKMFSEFFVKNEKMCGFFEKYDIIIPVPMTNKKIKERGYNQTEIIAKIISQNITNITMQKNVLIKYKNNKVQSQLNKEQRQQNVQNVYELNNEEIIKNKNILILDDIYTTGATCNECVKTLRNAQPKKIGIITIAKDCEKIHVKNNRKEWSKWKI